MTVLNKVICCSVFLLGACVNNNKDEDKNTLLFKQYLNQNFGKAISLDTTKYLMISSAGCTGCISDVLYTLRDKEPNKGFFVIIPIKAFSTSGISQKWSDEFILIDSNNEVDRLPFHKGNVGILTTHAGRVVTSVTAEPLQVQQLVGEIFE